MKKNGFIAISLLYSFFLVFVSIMLTLLVTYSHNRILMNNVNNKVKNKLILYDTQTPDTSGALAPVLTGYMVPIYYDYTSESWATASKINTPGPYQWYNYGEFMWANVALINNSTNYNNYNNATPGTPINDNHVTAYFVWIPRFRYLIFNTACTPKPPATECDIIDTPDNERIRITFENNEEMYTNALNNGNYTTHPAFLLSDYYILEVEDGYQKVYQSRLDGIWVGKYETTGTQSSPTIKSGLNPLASLNYDAQYTVGYNFNAINGVGSKTRMMKNTEWGAVVYLTQSKYGIKGNSEYLGIRSVDVNTSDYTGGAVGENGFAHQNSIKQSTTGNVYGIYDMAGLNPERMFNYLEDSGSKYPSSPSLPIVKEDYDLYTLDNSISGDATYEIDSWITHPNSRLSTSNPTYIRGVDSIFRYQAASSTVANAFRIVIPMKGT